MYLFTYRLGSNNGVSSGIHLHMQRLPSEYNTSLNDALAYTPSYAASSK